MKYESSQKPLCIFFIITKLILFRYKIKINIIIKLYIIVGEESNRFPTLWHCYRYYNIPTCNILSTFSVKNTAGATNHVATRTTKLT